MHLPRPPQQSTHEAVVERLQPGPMLSFGRTRRAEWVRITLSLPTAPVEGLRLLHLSDLHLRRRPLPVMERIIERIDADPPDAVLITGDFVDDKLDHSAAIRALEAMLPRLKAKWGVFGILGNHDGDLLAGRLGALGVTLIEGRRLNLRRDGRAVAQLVGLAGVSREEPHPLFETDRDAEVPLVVLSHYPDAIRRLGRLRPDLVLAGHTHGGQLCLPGGRPLLTHDSLPKSMACGAHRTAFGTDFGWLIVSRGLGATAAPMRIFAPPQVVEVVLRRE